jgi:WD40 repeat protein
VSWSPDGTRLASAGQDGRIQIWDPVTATQTRELTGYASGAYAVSWNPDGTRLAAAGIDGQVRLWDPADGVALAVLIPLAAGWAVFGGDGLRYKYSGTVNGEFWWTVGLCPFAPAELDPYFPELTRLPIDAPLSMFGPGDIA